tara:strand:- start:31251 stop:32852 length:1602 start_codon:yes stop_codon:yes gene_type:complete
MGKIFLFLRTIRHLKFRQIAYRIFYVFRAKYRRFVRFKLNYNFYRKGKPLRFDTLVPTNTSYASNTFTFLNQSITFSDGIDWDYMDNGKLWAYNLNYFDFLNQENMQKEIGEALIFLFVDQIRELKNANEPYPTSLRGINWIKFFSVHSIEKKSFDRYLYSQYRILLDQIEYHLLGNHLLENGFSLFFGGYYFKGLELYQKGKEIISVELREQILKDGAHFELSPMYHKILLLRLLDAYNLSKNNKEIYEDSEFEEFLLKTAQKMLGWLESVTFSNGSTPRVNDSTEGISSESKELFDYAKRLGIVWERSLLSESGYRLFKGKEVELFVDYGMIGPSYIPGHAHSDTFSFVLNYKGQPVIVDPGISTYNIGYRRQRERSTSSHNTVRYAKVDQSEVWGGFRVGRRARAIITEENETSIKGYHNGYKRFGVYHQRVFDFNDTKIKIEDNIVTKNQLLGKSSAYFHFYPGIEIKIDKNRIVVDGCNLEFSGASGTRVKEYTYAHGYNSTEKAKLVEVLFEEKLITNITLNGFDVN